MFYIKSNIKLTDVNRKNPLQGSTCRPLLFFSNGLIRTGLIIISPDETLDMTGIYHDRLIGIHFYKDINPFNDFVEGTGFDMREGSLLIGTGIVTECLGEDYPT